MSFAFLSNTLTLEPLIFLQSQRAAEVRFSNSVLLVPAPRHPRRRVAIAASGRFLSPCITVYPRTASGDTPPLRDCGTK